MNLTSTVRTLGKNISAWVKKNVLHRHEENEQNYEGKILGNDSSFGMMESYRSIRTNLMYTGTMTKSPVIAVTSAMPNEGKSLTCTNLAICFAMTGKKVLVIDGDMRNPSQAKTFGAEGESEGLSEFLSGQVTEPNVIALAQHEGVHLLKAGRRPPNSTELLLGENMDVLFARSREDYDMIFVDLPPIGMVTDGVVIAEKVDGYLMVVEAACSDSVNVSRAVDSLEKVNAKILGFILNNVSQKGGRYGYGHYSHYNHYNHYNHYSRYQGEAEESAKQASAADAVKRATPASGAKKNGSASKKGSKKKK